MPTDFGTWMCLFTFGWVVGLVEILLRLPNSD